MPHVPKTLEVPVAQPEPIQVPTASLASSSSVRNEGIYRLLFEVLYMILFCDYLTIIAYLMTGPEGNS